MFLHGNDMTEFVFWVSQPVSVASASAMCSEMIFEVSTYFRSLEFFFSLSCKQRADPLRIALGEAYGKVRNRNVLFGSSDPKLPWGSWESV